MADRSECKVLGKVLGTFDGWDGEFPTFMLYDFQPAAGINIKPGDLGLDYDSGLFDVIAEDGSVIDTGSILPLLD